MTPKTFCGYIALVGAPNAGKSTLLNTIVGSKVSIVSRKAQTTRCRVLGILQREAAQMIFADIPGIFAEPKRRLEKAMVAAAWQGAFDADVILVVIDAARRDAGKEAQTIVKGLKDKGRTAFLALNKIDLVEKENLLALTAELNATGVFEKIFMISAATGDGVEDLLNALAQKLPPGPWLYPEDQISDMPLRLLAAEIFREKIFLQLHEEIPYSVSVETESWEERADGSAAVGLVVYVLKEGQKAILLGKGGARIKALGTAAREEMEEAFGRRIHLRTFVKVRENWMEDPAHYRAWGLDFNQ